VKDIPVGEESKMLSVSKNVSAIRSLDYARLLPSSHTVYRIKVDEASELSDVHIRSPLFFDNKPFKDRLEKIPAFAFAEGIANVAHHYAAWSQCAVNRA